MDTYKEKILTLLSNTRTLEQILNGLDNDSLDKLSSRFNITIEKLKKTNTSRTEASRRILIENIRNEIMGQGFTPQEVIMQFRNKDQ
ncbi:hypothetical protein ABT56_19020 [Photobacterium aquae]|uniref:DNA-binding protein H-NS-like N-terminal domain-containing protein n=1 Tax=Photobacterium aquae TaxID=1195763 RepID=A0A0J1GV75_9GAMM|nr:hypothetical protein ABT56_19020 [Photobacterium aquae]